MRSTWQNWVNLVLGLWVFISPWAVEHSLMVTGGAVANLYVVGAVVAIVSAVALYNLRAWEEWTNMILGVWLFFSPWIFGYSGDAAFTWNSVIAGALIVAFSGAALPVAQRQQQVRA